MMNQQQAQGFQDTNNFFAQQIKARRASLNKVTTIVTHLPTVMSDQQDKPSTFKINNRKKYKLSEFRRIVKNEKLSQAHSDEGNDSLCIYK